jgi:hypothetical protein
MVRVTTLSSLVIIWWIAGANAAGAETKGTKKTKGKTEKKEVKDDKAAMRAAQKREMAKVINDLTKLPDASVHRWLKNANDLIGGKFSGAPFDDAVEAAENAGLHELEGWENGSAIHRRYLLKEGVFTFGGGVKADAYLFFSSRNKVEAQVPFEATDIYRTDIGLTIDVNLPYEKIVAEKIFPDNSAMRRVMDLDEVKSAGAEWPHLKRMTVTYTTFFNRWVEYHPSGFSLEVKFVASLEDEEIGYNSISGFIASGLEPARNIHGKPPKGKFKPADTLEDPNYNGGSSGWSGEEKEIEANKKKYLRTPAKPPETPVTPDTPVAAPAPPQPPR